jgi:hemerythrin-like domain-containing protein
MPKKSKTKEPAPSPKEHGSEKDALALLKSDHTEVKRLLKQLNNTEDDETEDREALLNEIEAKLKTHTEMEEQIFYPAFKEAVEEDDQHIYFEAIEEHGLVDIVLPELKETEIDSQEFKAKAKVLLDLVEHHIEEEEGEMFPKARKAIGAEELRELGERMAEFMADFDEGEPEDAEDMEDSDEFEAGRKRKNPAA